MLKRQDYLETKKHVDPNQISMYREPDAAKQKRRTIYVIISCILDHVHLGGKMVHQAM